MRTLPALLVMVLVSACGAQPEPATPRTRNDESVPANSAFEKAPVKTTPAAPPATVEEPTAGPVLTAAAPTATSPPVPLGGSGAPAAGGPKVSKGECGKLFDRYLDLEIGSNPELAAAGVTKEMIAQAKAGAMAQSGGDPCGTDPPTRAQYTCAMGAKTPERWRTCMK